MMDEPLDIGYSAERWQAAGVRHAVLLRALPALRHDVAAPISVMQMTASVLQRKLALEPLDAAYCVQRVAAFEQQIDVLTDALRWLFDWGVGVADNPVSRTQLVGRCVGLLQPLWALEGVAVEVDAALKPGAGVAQSDAPNARTAELRWPRQAALRYLLLAALCYVHDRRPGLATIRVVPDRHDALQLQGVHSSNDDFFSSAIGWRCRVEAAAGLHRRRRAGLPGGRLGLFDSIRSRQCLAAVGRPPQRRGPSR